MGEKELDTLLEGWPTTFEGPTLARGTLVGLGLLLACSARRPRPAGDVEEVMTLDGQRPDGRAWGWLPDGSLLGRLDARTTSSCGGPRDGRSEHARGAAGRTAAACSTNIVVARPTAPRLRGATSASGPDGAAPNARHGRGLPARGIPTAPSTVAARGARVPERPRRSTPDGRDAARQPRRSPARHRGVSRIAARRRS